MNKKKGDEEEDERACVDVYEYPSLELKKLYEGVRNQNTYSLNSHPTAPC